MNDYEAILMADSCHKANDMKGMFDAISKGLACNSRNYELYYMLGEYYLKDNPYQAYLCFENALYYCKDAKDSAFIRESMDALREQGIHVPGISVVIVSYNLMDMMKLCLDSLKKTSNSDSVEIIVVDNASVDGTAEWLKEQPDIRLVLNSENVGFTAACNQAVRLASPENDILILHNDTIVTYNAVFWLRMGLYDKENVGAAGCITTKAYNYQTAEGHFDSYSEAFMFGETNNVPMEKPYERKLFLQNFAVAYKRDVINKVGMFDERFSPGICDDDDYFLRISVEGYILLMCRNSFVVHFGESSFGQDADKYIQLRDTNYEKFEDKWGFDCQYYKSERRELTEMITCDTDSPIHVLDVGCGLGNMLCHIGDLFPNAVLHGIEISEAASEVCRHTVPSVVTGNVEDVELPYEENYFDYIVCADVIEHLRDPKAALLKLSRYLKSDGHLIASIPNICHYSVIIELLRGHFKYEDSGILDRTHLKFFTHKEILNLLDECGLAAESVGGKDFGLPTRKEDCEMYEALMKLPGIAPEYNFRVYQYLVKARKK